MVSRNKISKKLRFSFSILILMSHHINLKFYWFTKNNLLREHENYYSLCVIFSPFKNKKCIFQRLENMSYLHKISDLTASQMVFVYSHLFEAAYKQLPPNRLKVHFMESYELRKVSIKLKMQLEDGNFSKIKKITFRKSQYSNNLETVCVMDAYDCFK